MQSQRLRFVVSKMRTQVAHGGKTRTRTPSQVQPYRKVRLKIKSILVLPLDNEVSLCGTMFILPSVVL